MGSAQPAVRLWSGCDPGQGKTFNALSGKISMDVSSLNPL